MAKKAFCVGINDYPLQKNDLKGCVNDAHKWAGLLKNNFDFPESDIRILLDNDATKAKMIEGLDNLLTGAKAGDVLVYTFSGHGTYIYDKAGEDEAYDQAQCPYDCKDNLVVDDELRERFSNIPEGVRLTVISDSCHSGSITRGEEDEDEELPDERRPRFLNPELFGSQLLNEVAFDDLRDRLQPLLSVFDPNDPQASMNEILLSGCKEKEFSWDAKFGNVYHGALTFYAYETIKAHGNQLTYQELHKKVRRHLMRNNFKQNPQLQGHDDNKNRLIFT